MKMIDRITEFHEFLKFLFNNVQQCCCIQYFFVFLYLQARSAHRGVIVTTALHNAEYLKIFFSTRLLLHPLLQNLLFKFTNYFLPGQLTHFEVSSNRQFFNTEINSRATDIYTSFFLFILKFISEILITIISNHKNESLNH